MPAAVIPFPSTGVARRAVWSLLEIARPGTTPQSLGILLVDEETGWLSLRLKDESEFDDLDEQELDYLAALAADLQAKGQEAGGGPALIASLEDSLSGFLRIGDRTAIEYTGAAGQTVDRLYDAHVDREVRPFVTHLPFYGLRAAATKFGEEFEQAESYKRSEELATAHATIMKAALKTGFFDEDAAGRIALDLIGRCRPDLIPNQP